MLILKFLLHFIKVLNEKATPRAIAGGIALGAVIGITPKGSLHNAGVLLLIFLLPVNRSAALFSTALFALFSYAADPLFNLLGQYLLTRPGLRGLWTTLYNTPVVPWTRFNNTLTLGSLTAALALSAPLFTASAWAVQKYRDTLRTRVRRWKIVQILSASKYYAWYKTFS